MLLLLLMLGMWVTFANAADSDGFPLEPSSSPQHAGRNLWRASVVALATANVADAGSSWGKYELNSNLSGNNGRFGRDGALLKVAIVGGMVAVQAVILRHRPSAKLYRGLALLNGVSASVTGATAIRNLGIPRQ